MVNRERAARLARLADETFDLLVIGGGITGAGVALDAADRGLRVALIERSDFASGTSSRSSKLVHGGVRYLRQREFKLVHEALAERQTLIQIAPHLVQRQPFLLPLYGDWTAPLIYNAGLTLYDLLAGRRGLGRHRSLSAAAARQQMPTLRARGLRGGLLYYDGRTDDARLTLAVLRSAEDRGAVAVNYVEAAGLIKEQDRVRGVSGQDQLSGVGLAIRARHVVNTAGVWLEKVAGLDGKGSSPRLRPSKGAHIVVPRARLRHQPAVILPETSDGRVVFLVPWGSRTIIGTTDTEYRGPLDRPQAEPDDVAFLLAQVNRYTDADLARADIVSHYAGLRPLVAGGDGGSSADLSRRHRLYFSPSGLLSVAGGKLTTYRRMAEDAVDAIVAREPAWAGRRANTAALTLRGGAGYATLRDQADALAARHGLAARLVRDLLNRYGDDTPAVLDLLATVEGGKQPLAAGLPFLTGEVVWATRHEQARAVADVLWRRVRLAVDDLAAARACAPRVAALLAAELGWDATQTAAEVEAFNATLDGPLPPPLP